MLEPHTWRQIASFSSAAFDFTSLPSQPSQACLLAIAASPPPKQKQPLDSSLAMDSSTALELLDVLDEQIDDLKPAIEPLLKGTISGAAMQLPVVDKAKLYVLTSYVLESLLFCNFPQTPHLTIVQC